MTAITLVPAGLAALGASPSERRQFIMIAACYLGFGTLVGLLGGSLRPQLVRRRVAIALGALVGAVGFVLLVSFRDARPTFPDFGLALFAGLLGLATGAFLGWWTWRRARAWGLR